MSSFLKAEDLVVQLRHWLSRLVSKSTGSFFHGADHGRRAANEYFDVCGGGGAFILIRYVSLTLVNVRRGGQTLIMSAVTNPTPPVQFSGGLLRT